MDIEVQMIADSLSGLKVAVIDDVDKFTKLEILFSKDRHGMANIDIRIREDADLFDHLIGAERIYVNCYGMQLYKRCITRGRVTTTDGEGKAKGWSMIITLGDDVFLRKEDRNSYYSLTSLDMPRMMKRWWSKGEYKEEFDKYVDTIHPDHKEWFIENFLEDMSAETEAIADILLGTEVRELTMFIGAPRSPFFDLKVEESIGDPIRVILWSDSTQITDYVFVIGDYVRLDLKDRRHSVSGTFRCTKCVREPSKVAYTFDFISSLGE